MVSESSVLSGRSMHSYRGCAKGHTSRVLHFRNQVHFRQVRNASVRSTTTSQAGNLLDERGGDDFMVLAALLDLRHTFSSSQRRGVKSGDLMGAHTAARTRQSSLDR